MSHILGYAVKDCAVYWLMKTYPDVYARHGRKWDGDELSYCHVGINSLNLFDLLLHSTYAQNRKKVLGLTTWNLHGLVRYAQGI